jgi:predicted nucleotidyltransferase component of viral defense system
MNKSEDFNRLIERAMLVAGRANMRPVIAKELLHYDILFCLDNDGLLDKLTFQGGTSLRLCYGAPRLSEDLDFVGGREFVTAQLMKMKNSLEKYIGERYGLEILVKEPKEIATISQYQDIKVDKWQLSLTTASDKKDIPKQKIKIEVVNIPAYSRVPQSLQQNYDFLPDGYSDTLIMTETLDEIMADKLISLVSNQRYIRYRDILDLRWLKQQGAT